MFAATRPKRWFYSRKKGRARANSLKKAFFRTLALWFSPPPSFLFLFPHNCTHLSFFFFFEEVGSHTRSKGRRKSKCTQIHSTVATLEIRQFFSNIQYFFFSISKNWRIRCRVVVAFLLRFRSIIWGERKKAYPSPPAACSSLTVMGFCKNWDCAFAPPFTR